MSNEISTDAPPFAVGMGYDVHAFATGRPLVLGGVTIPSDRGLLGHSDADVLLHALCDALLGAAGLRDIGCYFPNTDEKWKGADSRDLLREVLRLITVEGWRVGNVDIMVIAEVPKISPYLKSMTENISDDLSIAPQRVSIKATTNEGMGFVGRKEGIAALANILLYR